MAYYYRLRENNEFAQLTRLDSKAAIEFFERSWVMGIILDRYVHTVRHSFVHIYYGTGLLSHTTRVCVFSQTTNLFVNIRSYHSYLNISINS